MMLVLLFAAVAFLAWSNGANDNFKGVAALYGSGIASYRKALAWATVTTGAGSVAGLFLAAELLRKFSGKGLVPEFSQKGVKNRKVPVPADLMAVLRKRKGYLIGPGLTNTDRADLVNRTHNA